MAHTPSSPACDAALAGTRSAYLLLLSWAFALFKRQRAPPLWPNRAFAQNLLE